MAVQPHPFAPLVGTVRCAVCNSPRLALIHAADAPGNIFDKAGVPGEPGSEERAAYVEAPANFARENPGVVDALAAADFRGKPFPEEPAFGSPEAVGQAAETIRLWAWRSSGMRQADPAEAWEGVYYVRAEEHRRLMAEVELLREENERLAAFLENLEGEAAMDDEYDPSVVLSSLKTLLRDRREGAAEDQREAEAQRDALEPLLDLIDEGSSTPTGRERRRTASESPG